MNYRLPFFIGAGVVVLVGAVAGGQFLWHRYWQAHYRDIPAGQVSLSLEPRVARAGDVIALVAEFRDAYDEGFPTANRHVRIVDGRGVDVLQRDTETSNVGFHFPGAEGIGCAMVIAAPTEPPKRLFTHLQSIEVLAQTPAGSYVVEIDPGAYCNGLPSVAVRLPLQVLAPSS